MMRAAIFEGVGKPLVIGTVDDPTPEPGEAIIRVRYCGVCGTDLHYTEDHETAAAAGTVLGHEFTGEIVALHSKVPAGWSIGDRVSALPFIGCTECQSCREGKPYTCRKLRVAGFSFPGGFGEYTRVHLDEAVRLPESVSWEEGALVEPLAVTLHGIRKIRNGLAGRNVLIIGAGPIGLAATMWCRFFGARHIQGSELAPGRARMAEALGATGTIDAREPVADAFREAVGGPPDLIIECVGIPGMIASCYDMAPHGAELLVLGFCVKPDTTIPSVAMVKELTVQFACAYDRTDFRFVVDMLAARRIDPGLLITEIFPYETFPAAFEALRTPGRQCKILLKP
jgi:(R,R)-butanediol dehydrogenase/meso-butanediol dehydrogenase/diacetyl reductase